MAITEQEILDKIKETELEQKEARSLVTFHKKAAIDAESQLIAANLKAERLKEELRVFRLKYPRKEESYEEKELREFRVRLPELLKKI